MKTKITLLTLTIIAATMLFSCYPNEDLSYSDTDVAVTRYDNSFAFSDAKICVLFDTVMHIVDEDETAEAGPNDVHTLDQIEKNLKEYTKFDVYRVKDTNELKAKGVAVDDIDLAITTTAMETDVYYNYYYPWYDWWYWWGWYPYYKSGSLKSGNNADYYWYPYYPWGGGTYYSYTSGTIMIDMVNAKGIEEIKGATTQGGSIKLPVVWQGIINGVLSGNVSDQKNRITTQVEKCFKQSPYLK
jgi:hypothetical protein